MSGELQTQQRRPPQVPVCILLISHFTRALEKPEKRGQSRRLQVKLQTFISDHKVVGSIPEDDVRLSSLFPALICAHSVNLLIANSLREMCEILLMY